MMFLMGGGGGGGGGGKSSSSSSSSGSKGGKGDVSELAKEWKRNLQKESRKIDRDILNIQRQEDRAKKECQKLAKQNQLGAARILAKEIVQTRKTIERMYVTKAQLNSVANNLQTSVSMIKMQGVIAKSADIMKSMNQLVNIKEVSESMRSMAREMERAGLIEEMIGDTLDSLDDASLETEADAEVDKVITEITSGILAPAGAAPTKAIPQKAPATAAATTVETEEVDASTEELLKRLQAL